MLSRVFKCLFARFRFALIGGNWTAQLTGNHRGIGSKIQILETELQVPLPSPAPPTKRSGELTRRLRSWLLLGLTFLILFGFIRKDIYLFGGSNDKAKVPTPFEDVHKLSMCK